MTSILHGTLISHKVGEQNIALLEESGIEPLDAVLAYAVLKEDTGNTPVISNAQPPGVKGVLMANHFTVWVEQNAALAQAFEQYKGRVGYEFVPNPPVIKSESVKEALRAFADLGHVFDYGSVKGRLQRLYGISVDEQKKGAAGQGEKRAR